MLECFCIVLFQQLRVCYMYTQGLLHVLYSIKCKEPSCSWSYGSWIYNGAYHHLNCEFKSHSWRGVLDTILCDKVSQWLESCPKFSPGTPNSFTNKTDHHDITEIFLKVALNTINPNPHSSGVITNIFAIVCTRNIIFILVLRVPVCM